MQNPQQPENPDIRLIETNGEVTLAIDDDQAMQGWEHELMCESADLLCTFGSQFLEVGLGLGISALRIASNPGTQRHVVVEKYAKVIELFYERNPTLPAVLEIVHADFFDYITKLEPGAIDGILFDPHLPKPLREDEALWNAVVPQLVRALRVGGALVPCFSTYPVLRWQFVPFFDRVIVERRPFAAYPSTDYLARNAGDAFIQCFIKTR